MDYTTKELDQAALADLQSDARQAREQAARGPFYPEKGITAESCTAYAQKCERQIRQYRTGGAHKAILRGA